MKPRQSFTDRIVRRVFYKYYARNLLYELQLRARSEAADYVQAHMPNAVIFRTHRDILRHAARSAPPGGLLLEFGVAGGKSIREIAAAAPSGAVVHGFDTFEGLPEDWTGHVESAGAFRQRGLPKVPGNVRLHRGLFQDTLPPFLEQTPGPIAFAHIDCDLYSSTATVLDALGSRLGPGTLILFDEYFNYPAWRHHEFKAWHEFVSAQRVAYTYLAFTAQEGRVLVRVDDIPA